MSDLATNIGGMGGSGTGCDNVATDETGGLSAASKVDGAKVYSRQVGSLGMIHHVMVNTRSGQVAHAVTSCDGFLGIGDIHHPLPWSVPTYDTGQGGYVVDRDRLQGASFDGAGDSDRWAEPGYTRPTNDDYLRAMAPGLTGSGQSVH